MSIPENALDGAILQRDKATYAIVPRTPLGLLTPQILDSLNTVVKKYGIPIVKITSGQRIALVGLKPEDIPNIWKDLGIETGRAIDLCVHYVQCCPGTTVCQFGIQDSIGIGLEIEEMYKGFALPAKFKFGVSGCQFSCGEGRVRDLGLIGKKGGWTVTFGGNAGMNPRAGDIVAEDLSKEDTLALIRKLIEYYRDNAKKKERTFKFVERVGIDSIKAAVLG